MNTTHPSLFEVLWLPFLRVLSRRSLYARDELDPVLPKLWSAWRRHTFLFPSEVKRMHEQLGLERRRRMAVEWELREAQRGFPHLY